MDSDSRRRYTKILSRSSGIPASLIDIALLPSKGIRSGCGANRNQILLANTGKIFVSIDDDSILRAILHPQMRDNTVNLSCHQDPFDHWTYKDRACLLSSAQVNAGTSVISRHNEVIGRYVGDLYPSGRHLEVSHICQHLCADLIRGDASVIVSSAGVAGDSGTSDSMYLNLLVGKSRERVLGDDRRYLMAHRSREVLRVSDCITVVHGSPLLGGCIAIDNRERLPPFLPLGRNADGLFGQMAAICVRGGYIVQLPWAYYHFPPETREYTGSVGECGGRFSISELLSVMIRFLFNHPGGISMISSVRTLGIIFSDFSFLGIREIENELRKWLSIRFAEECAQIEYLKRDQTAISGRWELDVREWITCRRNAIVNSAAICPAEFATAGDPWAGLERFRSLVRDYATLLSVWPEITTAAQKCNSVLWDGQL